MTACHRFDPAGRGGGASSARPGLSGAICPAGRGAAALSYIAMYGAAGRDLLPARASSARRAVQIGGIIGPARGGPVLYSYVGRGRGWYGAGGAAVWCRCEVWPVWAAVWGCCPLLYSYVGRGGVRSPTGAGHHRPGAWRRRGVACPAFSGGRAGHHRRGAACPGRSVQRGGVLLPSPI